MKFLPCDPPTDRSRFVTSRLGVKSQTVVPKEVRDALGSGPATSWAIGSRMAGWS